MTPKMCTADHCLPSHVGRQCPLKHLHSVASLKPSFPCPLPQPNVEVANKATHLEGTLPFQRHAARSMQIHEGPSSFQISGHDTFLGCGRVLSACTLRASGGIGARSFRVVDSTGAVGKTARKRNGENLSWRSPPTQLSLLRNPDVILHVDVSGTPSRSFSPLLAPPLDR